MFALQSMFGAYDHKTLSNMFVENEEYLESLGRKVPIIRKLFEEQTSQEQDEADAVDNDTMDPQANAKLEVKNAKDISKQNAANESFVEKMKQGVVSWFSKDTKVVGNVLDKERGFAPEIVVSDAKAAYPEEHHSFMQNTETPANKKAISLDD